MSSLDTAVRYGLHGLTQRQAYVLADALELVSRIGMGQLEYVMEFVRSGGVTDPEGKPISFAALAQGDELMRQLKPLLTGFDMNASKGISGEHVPAQAQVAWELRKVIRNRLANDRTPAGDRFGVDFDDPYMLKYTDEPRVELRPETVPSALSELPDGCFIGQLDTEWTVVRPEDNGLTIIGRGSSAAAAIAQAKAAVAKLAARDKTNTRS